MSQSPELGVAVGPRLVGPMEKGLAGPRVATEGPLYDAPGGIDSVRRSPTWIRLPGLSGSQLLVTR